MITLDYNTTVEHQFGDVNKSRKKINFFFNNSLDSVRKWFKGITRGFINKSISNINTRLTSQLLNSKGILSDLQGRVKSPSGEDFTALIKRMDDLIILHISFKEEVERIIDADKKIQFPDILVTNALLEETIEVQYDILRLLKRYNQKSSIETSSLASESNERSLISLETATNERRTT
jgi:hypothetical protein